ncbi:MAG TPA: hypothetical protein VK177_07405 [Flavobacteriales bacterium]|nr:hypothetical protein [Flavobacteriales bacterium]
MKKSWLMLVCFLAVVMSVQAQPGLKKIKDKAKEKINDKTDSQNSESGGSNKSQGKSSAAVEKSPAKQTIQTFRSDLSFARSAVKKDPLSAEDEMEGLKKLLDKIKKEDPDFEEYDKDEKAYLDLKQEYDLAIGKLERGNKLFDMYNWSTMIGKEPWRYTELDYAQKLARPNFEKIKSYYEGETLTDREKKQFDAIEDFYVTTCPKIKQIAMKEIKEKLDGISFWRAENRSKPDYMERFELNLDPKRTLNTIASTQKTCETTQLLIQGDAELEAAKKDLDKLKTEIEQYVSSGQFEKDCETKKAMIIEARRLLKPLTIDASMDAIIKRDLSPQTGTIQRISIITRDWVVVKNEFDLPLRKVKDVEIAVKKEGRCFIERGQLVSVYEGAGKYGKVTYQSAFYELQEMNCANVNK